MLVIRNAYKLEHAIINPLSGWKHDVKVKSVTVSKESYQFIIEETPWDTTLPYYVNKFTVSREEVDTANGRWYKVKMKAVETHYGTQVLMQESSLLVSDEELQSPTDFINWLRVYILTHNI